MEVNHKALAFRIRMQFGLRAQIGGWHNTSAEELVREITAFYRLRRHNEVVDAIILAALESNLCLLYTSPSPRDKRQSRMPSSA